MSNPTTTCLLQHTDVASSAGADWSPGQGFSIDATRARRQRYLVAAVQVLGLAVWFSATAIVPTLQNHWEMSAADAVWLTASVQLGFVVGAVASTLLNLADRLPVHVLLAGSAGAAAASTLTLALFVDSLSAAIPLRFATGVFLAGVYPVGMKVTASWAPPQSRGRAFGVLIGALTLGSALPHLIGGLGDLPWRTVLIAASTLGAVGAVVALVAVRQGPLVNLDPPRPRPRYALEMFRSRRAVLINAGYFGHMWELYAWWTWLPAFVIASQRQRAESAGMQATGLLVFAAIGIAGVAGALVGGWAADRYGRPKAATSALAASGICCLLSPLLFGAPLWLLGGFLMFWGAAVIADSGVFSTSLTEVVDPRYVGTALTTQTAVGFSLTVVSIHLVAAVADAMGWKSAMLVLAVGPLIGAVCMAASGPPAESVRPASDDNPQQ